jgi:hypothetical protein
MVSHNIPISELYKIEGCCNHSEANSFCAVQIKIENMELQKKYKGRYLLQVWSKKGELVYSKILQQPLHLWNLIGDHLIFVQSEKEPVKNQYR